MGPSAGSATPSTRAPVASRCSTRWASDRGRAAGRAAGLEAGGERAALVPARALAHEKEAGAAAANARVGTLIVLGVSESSHTCAAGLPCSINITCTYPGSYPSNDGYCAAHSTCNA